MCFHSLHTIFWTKDAAANEISNPVLYLIQFFEILTITLNSFVILCLFCKQTIAEEVIITCGNFFSL